MLTWSTSFSSFLFLAAGLLFLFSLDFLCCCALLEETLCGKLAWVARKTRGRMGYRGAVAFLFGAHLAQIGAKRPVADPGNRKRNCQYTKLFKNRKAVGLGDIMAGRRLGESKKNRAHGGTRTLVTQTNYQPALHYYTPALCLCLCTILF